MKKSLLITAIVLALSGGAFAQTVLPLLPASHGMTGNQPAYSAQQQQEFPAMATGWNWWSSYIDLSDDGLGMLEEMLGSNAQQIKSQNSGFIVYNTNNDSWIGTLTEIDNSKMYCINMSLIPALSLTLRGTVVSPSNVQIDVHSGWTWIGYPCSTENGDIAGALTNFEANNNDQVKSYNSGFAIYNSSTDSWIGTMTSFSPGQGYKIKSNASEVKTFTFPTAARSNVNSNFAFMTQWKAIDGKYADNMTMIAIAKLMGEELNDANYEIGAYCNDECRGSIKLMDVQEFNHYYAFLSIFGESNESIEFRLLDHNTGEVYLPENRYTYSTDKAEGTLENPYILNFNMSLGNEELSNDLVSLFPNPANKGQNVKLVIPNNKEHLTVQITNILGSVVRNERMTGEELNISTNLVPGIYTIKVIDSNKQLYIKKLVVK